MLLHNTIGNEGVTAGSSSSCMPALGSMSVVVAMGGTTSLMIEYVLLPMEDVAGTVKCSTSLLSRSGVAATSAYSAGPVTAMPRMLLGEGLDGGTSTWNGGLMLAVTRMLMASNLSLRSTTGSG